MAFWWNIEDVQFTTAGTSTVGAHTADAGGTLKFDPPTRTSNYINNTNWDFQDCALLRSSGGAVPFASLPSTTFEPDERVCENKFFMNFTIQDDGTADIDKIHQGSFDFRIGQDPGDATKYAVFYRFTIRAGDFNLATVCFTNPANSSGSTSGSFTTGTFSIGAATFNWRAYYNTSISGASMSAATTSFTYP